MFDKFNLETKPKLHVGNLVLLLLLLLKTEKIEILAGV